VSASTCIWSNKAADRFLLIPYSDRQAAHGRSCLSFFGRQQTMTKAESTCANVCAAYSQSGKVVRCD
jgi:hypothetical protein